MSLRLQLFKGCLLLATLTVLYNEFLIYYVTLYYCSYPKEPVKNEGTVDAMILADTHLLGSRNGHWFDKLRREWQMYRSFQTANTYFSPEAVFFLGDIFDEGKWCPPEEFQYYVKRFNDLFYVKNETKRYALAGNHDIGFHYAVTPYLLERFQSAYKSKSVKRVKLKGLDFVLINSMAFHQDGCFLCKEAEQRLDKLSAKLKCEGKDCVRPILMSHFPLFRDSDEMCDELDEASSEEKFHRFKEKWDVISNASTRLLLDKVGPRGIFTGHTHNGCTTDHGGGVTEWTVSSFSWRNRKNPAFLLARFSNSSISVSKCMLPDENTVINIYLLLLAAVVLALLRYPFYHYYVNYVRMCLGKEMTGIKFVDVFIDVASEETIKDGASSILQHIRPEWSLDSVSWKVFTDGLTNKLIGAWHNDNRQDTVLFRIYGEGTDAIIDRKAEVDNMTRAHSIGIGSQLYAMFKNGLAYEFIHGDILDLVSVKDVRIYPMIAKMMAKFHTVDIKETSALESSSSPLVFCHNDALLANIVDQKNRVVFIDMEYAGPAPAAFDIANHFAEHVGADGVLDYRKWLPNKEFQMDWIKIYLTEFNRLHDRLDPSSGEVDNMFNSVQKFMLCAHLLWIAWALIQAANSSIDFDFVDYAIQRMSEYKRAKSLVQFD